MKPSYVETPKPVHVDRKIFISCAQDGLVIAREIEEELTGNGFTVFSGQSLQGGDFRADRLRGMIAKSDFFIALVTSEYPRDYFVFSELAQIVEEQRRVHGKRIMPIVLDRNAQVPAILAMYQVLDLSDLSSRKHGIRSLVETINISLSQNSLEWDDLVTAQSQNIKISREALRREVAAYSSMCHSQTAHALSRLQRGILVLALFTFGSILATLLFSDIGSSWLAEMLLGVLVVFNVLLGLVLLIKQVTA